MADKKSAPQKRKKAKVRVFRQRPKKAVGENAQIEQLSEKCRTLETVDAERFSDFPLSSKTLRGLKECGYTKPTEIQKRAIPLALRGCDVLGAAQTGSGKTLAFLVPLLECLYRNRWTNLDGLGALVITPTRELAYQIFETLRKVGRYHDFSAGLVIGGKDLKFERKLMDQCNIIIGTPGRLLQHMDENPLFDCVNLKCLVLDEADRCLDMGFEQTMNAIIANLPAERQTSLFSATQTKSVKQLSRVGLRDPKYVSTNEKAVHCTPDDLRQSYIVCKQEEKMAVVWSFIKSHLKQKSIVFMSSCKQVKYAYEIFCRLRPGVSILALYGSLHQMRRMDIYEQFCRKQSAVMIATDLASRGLDFPAVHWVLQADCPEDAETYIHRAGRTARYHRDGECLLLLTPHELKMLDRLREKRVPELEVASVDSRWLRNPLRKMEALLARDPALKDSAKRAFMSYIKAVHLMRDKEVFDVRTLDSDAYAHSLGLAVPPRVRFLQRKRIATGSKLRNADDDDEDDNDHGATEDPRRNDAEENDDDDDGNAAWENDEEEHRTEDDDDDDRFGKQQSQSKRTPRFEAIDSDEDDDDILTVKRANHDVDGGDVDDVDLVLPDRQKKKPLTKAAMAKKVLKKKIVANKKIVFDDEGQAVPMVNREKCSEAARKYEEANEPGIDIDAARAVLREEDAFDKKLFREKVKAKHREEKMKERNKKRKAKAKDDEQEDKDDHGEASEDGDEPDLSWLPDPDKIYGKRSDESESDVDRQSPVPPPKKKKKQSKVADTSSLSINETEELALMLLKNKKR